MPQIAASPEVLRWARERAGLSLADLRGKFPKLAEWEVETSQLTIRQLEDFAKATRVPFGFLFLPEPPEIPLPFADFRRVENRRPQCISPELMDTTHLMRRRQAWLREDQIEADVAPLEFVGSARLADDPAATGRDMRRALRLEDGWTGLASTWTTTVGRLRGVIEGLGIMVVVNGSGGNNTHRKLDVKESRGFALSDPLCPVDFRERC